MTLWTHDDGYARVLGAYFKQRLVHAPLGSVGLELLSLGVLGTERLWGPKVLAASSPIISGWVLRGWGVGLLIYRSSIIYVWGSRDRKRKRTT